MSRKKNCDKIQYEKEKRQIYVRREWSVQYDSI